MLEEILNNKAKNNFAGIVLLSFFLSVVGFVSALLLFSEHSSVAHVLITTILLIPLISGEIQKEEKAESKSGIRRFYKNHESIFRLFLLLFIGIFLAYSVITLCMVFFPAQMAMTHDYQITFIENSEMMTESMLGGNFDIASAVIGLIMQNIVLIVLCFILSLFYGSGGMFLVILNASIFATFLVESMRLFSDFSAFSMVFLIYLLFWFVPVTVAFLLAAISGGVMSKAFMHEKFGSRSFSNVSKDALVLLFISLMIILLGAVLQVMFIRMIV